MANSLNHQINVMPLKDNHKMPVIGITLDFEKEGSFSKLPHYAIRENYCSAVSDLGAVPLPLVHEEALVGTYADMIDGLIVIGGAFDVDPSLYGAASMHKTVKLKERRTRFEWGITQAALERKMPVLGICGGQQLLNVVLGGTLIQHIPDSVEGALEHEQPNPRHEPGHVVTVKGGTLLYDIVGESTMNVNTAHHQAVEQAAPGSIINATAPDGVIEGIELPREKHPFCLGVQWHPEYHVDSGDKKIFQAFVAACHHAQSEETPTLGEVL